MNWIIVKDKKPAIDQIVDVLYENGEEFELIYSKGRTCALAGTSGGHGYFDEGFATIEDRYICDEPAFWKPKE